MTDVVPARKILVTGANGFLGSAVVEALLSSGKTVRAAVRRSDIVLPSNCEKIVVGVLSESTDWRAAVKDVDCIFHIAGRAHVLRENSNDPLAEFRAVNRDATLKLAEAAEAASVRRMIFLSSIGVNGGETHGSPFTSTDPVAPHSDYAVAKAEAEEGLHAFTQTAKLEIVTIRPPLIIGKGAKGNLATLFRAIGKGIPLPLASVNRNRRDFVSVENLVSLLLVAAEHPDAPGRIFLASDGQPISTRQLVEHLGALSGTKPRLLPFPPSILKLLLGVLGRKQMASQLLGDLEVDISATREVLGWSPAPVYRKDI